MERFGYKPSMSDIFDALADEETHPDWDREVLGNADIRYVQRVRDILKEGLPLNEARSILRSLEK